MTTECNGKPFECQPLGKREVRASFVILVKQTHWASHNFIIC